MTDDNLMPFPERLVTPDLLIGPFQTFKVRVEGRVIPRLTGSPCGDKIELVVDGRFGATFSKEDAYQVAWLIGQAMAVGDGYSHLGAETKSRPFAPQAMEISPGETP